jgi:hypothetical protein
MIPARYTADGLLQRKPNAQPRVNRTVSTVKKSVARVLIASARRDTTQFGSSAMGGAEPVP